jgi:hypothetical protein
MFLQCPITCEPRTPPKFFYATILKSIWFVRMQKVHVRQAGLANRSLLVPPEHQIHSLRKLCAAPLVNSTRIDTYPLVSILLSLCTTARDLRVALLISPTSDEILKGDLATFPAVGKYSVLWDAFKELSELHSLGVEQSHCV